MINTDKELVNINKNVVALDGTANNLVNILDKLGILDSIELTGTLTDELGESTKQDKKYKKDIDYINHSKRNYFYIDNVRKSITASDLKKIKQSLLKLEN